MNQQETLQRIEIFDVVQQEHWIPVVGYEGLYEVSDLGRVRRVERLGVDGRQVPRKILPPRPGRREGVHLFVQLYRDGQKNDVRIHRLVLDSFVGPCSPGGVVRYRDGDPTNNSLANLHWDIPAVPDIDDERWLPIPGWEGLYEVSDHGRVKSLPILGHNRKVLLRVLKPLLRGRAAKYFTVHLRNSKRGRMVAIHVLVLETFVGPRPPGMHACHNDGDPANNRLENLRWDTPKANMADRDRHGTTFRGARPKKTHCKRGHEFTEENTLTKGDRRACLTCTRARVAARWRGCDVEQVLAEPGVVERLGRTRS